MSPSNNPNLVEIMLKDKPDIDEKVRFLLNRVGTEEVLKNVHGLSSPSISTDGATTLLRRSRTATPSHPPSASTSQKLKTEVPPSRPASLPCLISTTGLFTTHRAYFLTETCCTDCFSP